MCHAQRPVLTFVMIHLVRVPLTCKQLCCVNARLVLSGKTQIFCKFCKDPTTNYAMRYLHVKQKGRAQSCGQRYYSGVGVRLTQAQWCVHISWLACDHPAPGPLWHRTAATCLLWHCAIPSGATAWYGEVSCASQQAKPGCLSEVLMCQISIPATAWETTGLPSPMPKYIDPANPVIGDSYYKANASTK